MDLALPSLFISRIPTAYLEKVAEEIGEYAESEKEQEKKNYYIEIEFMVIEELRKRILEDKLKDLQHLKRIQQENKKLNQHITHPIPPKLYF